MSLRTRCALSLVVAAAGCSSTIKKPQLLHPGTAPRQRAAAQVFDPYPLPDLGPPVEGARPIDYTTPVDPVRRATLLRDSRPAAIGPVPVGPPLGAPYGAYPTSSLPSAAAAPRY